MRFVSLVHVEANCSVPDDADFAAVTRGWLESGVAFPSVVRQGPFRGGQRGVRGPAPGRADVTPEVLEARMGAAPAGLEARPLGLTLWMWDDSDEALGSVEIFAIDEHFDQPGQVRLNTSGRPQDVPGVPRVLRTSSGGSAGSPQETSSARAGSESAPVTSSGR